jgi:hypothetical protein
MNFPFEAVRPRQLEGRHGIAGRATPGSQAADLIFGVATPRAPFGPRLRALFLVQLRDLLVDASLRVAMRPPETLDALAARRQPRVQYRLLVPGLGRRGEEPLNAECAPSVHRRLVRALPAVN